MQGNILALVGAPFGVGARLMVNGAPVARHESGRPCDPAHGSRTTALANLATALAAVMDEGTPGGPFALVYAAVSGCLCGPPWHWLEAVLTTHLKGHLGPDTRLWPTGLEYAMFRSVSEAPRGVLVTLEAGPRVLALPEGPKAPGSLQGLWDGTPPALTGGVLGREVRDILDRRDPSRLSAFVQEHPAAAGDDALLVPLLTEPTVWGVVGQRVLTALEDAVPRALEHSGGGDVVFFGPTLTHPVLHGPMKERHGGRARFGREGLLPAVNRLALLETLF